VDPYLLMVYVASAFAVAALIFPVLIKILSGRKVFDAPGAHKIHKHYVPKMGGICILLGAVFSILIGLPFGAWGAFKFFFISVALMFIAGLRDDILTLSPNEKLVGQILPIILLVVFGDTLLTSFYGTIFQDFYFPLPLAWMITVFTIVILTNAYNLVDGIDGLAGTVAVICMSSFGIWFFIVGQANLALIAFALVGAVSAFLFFNWQPSRIFMGDTGTMVIGLVLSFLAIKFINLNFSLSENDPYRFQSSIGTAICVLIIPVFDTLRVIIIRLAKRQSPFRADHNHFHHVILSFGFSHASTVRLLAIVNLVFIGTAVILKNHGDTVILPVVGSGCIIASLVLRSVRKKYVLHAGESSIVKK
jgi:UDP-GlcNAc:undecaprenyl-phosphate/decaprenyl-phosphate GlcNAc-1-phosphate transferase